MCRHNYLPVSITTTAPGRPLHRLWVCQLCSAIEWRPEAEALREVSAWQYRPTPIPAAFLRAFEEDGP